MLTWREGALPSLKEARQALAPLAAPEVQDAPAESATASHVMPLPEIAELLADGDRAAFAAALDDKLEPVPSAFFEDFEFDLQPVESASA